MSKPRLVIVTDNPRSWSVPFSQQLVAQLQSDGFPASFVHSLGEAPDADVAIYLSCMRIVPARDRARFRHNLVVHASDLPRGRGWSPMTWSVLQGADRITVTLFEAADEVDSGPIYAQAELRLEGHELIDELRAKLDEVTQELILQFARAWPEVRGRAQDGASSFFPRRTPDDSRLDPDGSLRDNFNLLRTVDNDRYPAFFEHAGYVYELRITKRRPVG